MCARPTSNRPDSPKACVRSLWSQRRNAARQECGKDGWCGHSLAAMAGRFTGTTMCFAEYFGFAGMAPGGVQAGAIAATRIRLPSRPTFRRPTLNLATPAFALRVAASRHALHCFFFPCIHAPRSPSSLPILAGDRASCGLQTDAKRRQGGGARVARPFTSGSKPGAKGILGRARGGGQTE